MYLSIKYYIIQILFLIIFLNQIFIPYSLNISWTKTVIQEDSTTVLFSEDVLLSTLDQEYSHHVEPTLAIADDGTLFSGWKNAYSHNGGGVRVSFAKSEDGGTTWSEPFNMPMFRGIFTGQSDPWLVWSNGILYYAYLEYSIDTEELSQITLAISNNSGETWTNIAATNAEGFADKETMTVSSNGTMYVVYDDIFYNETEDLSHVKVRLTRSTDGGQSFQEISILADDIIQPDDHVAPYITLDGNDRLYIAWLWVTQSNWGDVYITSSNDDGETFSYPYDINPNSQNGTVEIDEDNRVSRITLPVIKFDQNDRLYALWTERFESLGEWDIYLRYSDDYGLNWSSRYQINPDISGDQWQPDMDIDSQDRIHIVFYNEQGDSFRPFYQLISFNGTDRDNIVIGDAIPITEVPTPNSFTRPGDYFTVRVDSNDVPHVVWSDGRNGVMDIYYSHGLTSKPSSTTQKTNLALFWIIALSCMGILRKVNRRK